MTQEIASMIFHDLEDKELMLQLDLAKLSETKKYYLNKDMDDIANSLSRTMATMEKRRKSIKRTIKKLGKCFN